MDAQSTESVTYLLHKNSTLLLMCWAEAQSCEAKASFAVPICMQDLQSEAEVECSSGGEFGAK